MFSLEDDPSIEHDGGHCCAVLGISSSIADQPNGYEGLRIKVGEEMGKPYYFRKVEKLD